MPDRRVGILEGDGVGGHLCADCSVVFSMLRVWLRLSVVCIPAPNCVRHVAVYGAANFSRLSQMFVCVRA